MRAGVFGAVLGVGLLVGAGPAAAQGNPSFNLVNRSPQAIAELYVTPVGVDRWGADRLARFFVLPGQTYPVRLPPGPCGNDLRVVYADGHTEERRRVDTCATDQVAFAARPGPPPPPPSPPQQAGDDPSFRLVNQGRFEIEGVFATPSGSAEWGQDRLGDDIVPAGATRVVRLPRGACTYDVRVVYGNGDTVERRRVNLCGITDLRVP